MKDKNTIKSQMPPFKASIISIIWLIIALFFFGVFSSCTKEEIAPTACIGDCETQFEVIYKNQLI